MTQELVDHIQQIKRSVNPAMPVASGKLVRGVGLKLEAVGCQIPIGGRCRVQSMSGKVEAEVVGFANDLTYLMPSESIRGIVPGSLVEPIAHDAGLAVGDGLLGRVLDGNGDPIDGLGAIDYEKRMSTQAAPINPLSRKPVSEPLEPLQQILHP